MYKPKIDIVLSLLVILTATFCEKVTYLSLEHPTVPFFHTKYLSGVNVSASRRGRSNPVYYVSINFYVHVYFGNNVSIDFFFYEWLSNRYQPSFVEMRFKFCNLVHKDSFFGPAFKQGQLNRPCPYPPGPYNLKNMTINPEVIPKAFPFRKGRIIVNVTLLTTMEQVVHGYIDMELKQINRKKGSTL
ncbi:hypothetical protein NE865_00462 [Phthorimaea operculella]|nr:hypothetical protein NE865_00462 [Phthorimaea operculella]